MLGKLIDAVISPWAAILIASQCENPAGLIMQEFHEDAKYVFF